MKRALITGITGQDGAYLAKHLNEKDYEVYGTFNRLSNRNFEKLNLLNILSDVKLMPCDLLDEEEIKKVINEVQPVEFYNLAALSSVAASFNQPIFTSEICGFTVLKILEAIKDTNRDIKFYQASSSEMFGNTKDIPQSEKTPFNPCSPYAVAKLFAHLSTINYRSSYGIFACSGILFNHESPLRGSNYVTKKIAQAVARIKYGLQDKLALGNLDIKRDWGYAPEYVEAMWLMLQQEKPDDYVISSGETHSIREFVEEAFLHVGLDWGEYVVQDETLYRPAEISIVLGDYSKAKNILGWEPKVKFRDLIKLLVDYEMKILKI